MEQLASAELGQRFTKRGGLEGTFETARCCARMDAPCKFRYSGKDKQRERPELCTVGAQALQHCWIGDMEGIMEGQSDGVKTVL